MAPRRSGDYNTATMMPRKLLVRVIFALLLVLAVEGVSLAGLAVLRARRGLTYFPRASRLEPGALATLDSLLNNRPGSVVVMDSALGWVPKDANAGGMRDDREYDREPHPGKLRISAFGESFTYGSDVPLEASWTKRISAMDSTIEILNFAIGGFGLDQAYLRYLKKGTEYNPHIVIIGYMSENLARNVNVFHNFYSDAFRAFILTKPRFKLANGQLVLLPNPLRTMADYRRFRDNQEQVLGELGKNDFHFVEHYREGPLDFSPSVRLGKLVLSQIRKSSQVPILTDDGRYETRSEAYQLTLRIFDEFYAKVLEDGALPLIVVLPDLNDQKRSREGKPRRYEPMLEYFRSRGYAYVDALEALTPVERSYTIDQLTVIWGHFSPLGNDLVARHVLGELVRRGFEDVPKVKAAAAAERQRLGRAARVNAP
jgi:hypothetical protein